MSEANYSIDEDLKEAQTMIKGLESYIQGSEIYGRVGGMFSGSMLTIGALLMRLRRLHLFHDQMTPAQQSQLETLETQHEALRKEWKMHYETKLVKEANSRLDGITAYFQELNESPGTAAGSYKPEALRRTLVQEILDAMDGWGVHSAELDSKARKVDNRLRGIGLQPSDFIWASALQPAYPQKVYWLAVQQTSPKTINFLLIAAVLLLAFLIASYHLKRESLWDDEAYTIWFIHDEDRPPEGILQTAQFIRHSLTNVLARVSVDVHPPLYFFTLDAWALLVGESTYAVRLLSVFFGLLALAATYAVGKQLFDAQTALIAVVILATASFFVYYTREARMYTLLIALASLSTWAYLRWRLRATMHRAVIYGCIMAALLYTHYAGALIILMQIVHGLIVGVYSDQRKSLWGPAPWRNSIKSILPYILTTTLYLPWIPTLVNQIRIQGGPSALPVPSDWGAVFALLLILTNGNWGLYVVPFALGSVLTRICLHGSALILLALWLLITPLMLLAINAWARPIFQIRYTIAILPAWALLAAYGLRFSFQFSGQWSAASDQRNTKRHFSQEIVRIWVGAQRAAPLRLLGFFFLLGLVYMQLAMYPQFWPDKPRWDEAVRQMGTVRQPLEPTITSIVPQSPVAYYDRLYSIRRGIAVDLSWRWQESEDINRYVDHVANAPSVWVVMPSNTVSAWDAVVGLLDGRHVGYRDSVMNMIFYRFDSGTGDSLHFRFGDALDYDGGIGHQLYAVTGEPFCFDMTMTTLKPLENEKIEWQLTQGYDMVRAALLAEIGTHSAGEAIKFSPCITIPPDSPPGPHHLRVSIMNGSAQLPLIESENLYWSDQLVLAQVSVSAGK